MPGGLRRCCLEGLEGRNSKQAAREERQVVVSVPTAMSGFNPCNLKRAFQIEIPA